jgi:DNA-binding CsgD family transcriptional regulator
VRDHKGIGGMTQLLTDPHAPGAGMLSEREKETLRLLLAGHDAKSIARRLDLSVHTVNERLRDARRKLGVSSSREAARLLAECEGQHPNFLGDNQFGVAESTPVMTATTPSHRPARASRLAWLSGGMLIMSLLIAAAALVYAVHGTGTPQAEVVPAAVAGQSDPMAMAPARDWLKLVDGQRWAESWTAAGASFQSHVTSDQWVATIRAVREQVGAPSNRILQTETKTTTIPGAPPGTYDVLQFRTDFAHKPAALETVALAREKGGWKVIGYFIQ